MFVKYCRAKHLASVLETGAIRIGTFFEYQETEFELVKDQEEGAAAFKLRADPDEDWVLTNAESNAVIQSPDEFRIINDWKFSIPAGATVVFIPRRYNTFLFSLSEVDDPSLEIRDRFGYDAAYEITDIVRFARLMGAALFQHLAKNSVSTFDPDRHSLDLKISRVQYVDQKVIEVTPETRHLLVESRDLDGKDFVTKPKAFEHESEVRIVFYPRDRTTDTFFSVRGEPPILEVDGLSEFVRPIADDEYL